MTTKQLVIANIAVFTFIFALLGVVACRQDKGHTPLSKHFFA